MVTTNRDAHCREDKKLSYISGKAKHLAKECGNTKNGMLKTKSEKMDVDVHEAINHEEVYWLT